MKRVEELFCDAFALCLFGDSYFYAFEHLTYPGGSARGSDYPKVEDRVEFLLFSANRRGLRLSSELAMEWRSSSDNPESDTDIDDVLDSAAHSLYAHIADAAAEIIDRSGVDTPNEKSIAATMRAFRSDVPVGAETALCDVICAGWRLIREGYETEGVDRSKPINELMLKSIEVSEFKRRTAAC